MSQSRKTAAERKASDRRELLEDDRLYGGLPGPGGMGGYGGLSPEILPDVAVDEKREKNGSDRKPGQDRTSKPWFSVHQGGNRGGLMMVPNMRRRVEEPKPRQKRMIKPIDWTKQIKAIRVPETAFVPVARKEFETAGPEDNEAGQRRSDWQRARLAQEQSKYHMKENSWGSWVRSRIWS